MVRGPEDADLLRPLHRGHAVALHHLVELVHALRAMDGERQVSVARRLVSIVEQVLRAGVDLRRADDARQTAGRVPRGLVDQRQRVFESSAATRFVPVMPRRSQSFSMTPACRREPGRQEHTQPAARREIDPARVVPRKIGDGGDTGQQHFAVGDLLARLAAGLIRAEHEGTLVQSAHIHRRQAVFLPHAAEERFGAGVRVDVDQARHYHQVAAVDRLVRLAGIVLADECDGVTGEHEIAAVQVAVTFGRGVPRHDPGGIPDAGGLRHRWSPGRHFELRSTRQLVG